MADLGTFTWPGSAGGGSGSNASVGLNSSTAPTSSTEVAGVNPTGNLQPLQTNAAGSLITVPDPAGVQHVIVDSSALPSGASTSALQTSGNSSLTSIDAKTPALGQQLAAASQPVVLTAAQITTLTPLTSVTVTQATGTNLHAVIDSGALTVTNATAANLLATVTQGPANSVANGWPVKITDGTSTAAVKAASTAAVAADPAQVVALSPNNNTLANSLLVKNTDGTNTAAVKAASTAAVAADPALVVAISPNNVVNTAETTSATSSVTSVASSASTVSLLASNASRKNAVFYNESTAILYLKLGATASLTSYTVQIPSQGYFEMPVGKMYTGAIDGIWSAANGSARITELT